MAIIFGITSSPILNLIYNIGVCEVVFGKVTSDRKGRYRWDNRGILWEFLCQYHCGRWRIRTCIKSNKLPKVVEELSSSPWVILSSCVYHTLSQLYLFLHSTMINLEVINKVHFITVEIIINHSVVVSLSDLTVTTWLMVESECSRRFYFVLYFLLCVTALSENTNKTKFLKYQQCLKLTAYNYTHNWNSSSIIIASLQADVIKEGCLVRRI